ncbi:MAG: hypothetical protein HY606_07135 [Planctomycetes bacterium]|nr:hypothetical protein [Planctomycetota bacterium]
MENIIKILLVLCPLAINGTYNKGPINKLSSFFDDPNIAAVSAGGIHSLALKRDGTVWSWGDNTYGQLGNGSYGNFETNPVQVAGLSNVTQIAAGYSYSLALRKDGTVWAWGWNTYGQLGNPTVTSSTVPIQSQINNAIYIAATKYSIFGFSAVIKNDRTLWMFGDNQFGQLGNGTSGWGTGSKIPVQVQGISNASQVSLGWAYTLVLKTDGTVWAWGNNNLGALGNGTTISSNIPVQSSGLNNITSISAGFNYGLAITANRNVYGWGADGSGQLGTGTAVVYRTTATLTLFGPAQSIATGYIHSMVLRTDGTLWASGDNSSGQLGNESAGCTGTCTTNPVPSKVLIDGVLPGDAVISAGTFFSLVIKKWINSTITMSWGQNNKGQLGNGTTTSSNVPVKVIW